MIVLGISGKARSGKDSFATIATKILEDINLKVDRHALAYELKDDLKELIKEKTGINVFTEELKEKNIIRPLLVAYGDMMRKHTDGKYWTSKMETKISTSKADVFIITDIRYDFYSEDECDWVKKKMGGKLIHITRYKIEPAPSKRRITTAKPVKIYDVAPNEHEMLNDPKCKAKADYAFEWEDMSKIYPNTKELLESDYMTDNVRRALKSVGILS